MRDRDFGREILAWEEGTTYELAPRGAHLIAVTSPQDKRWACGSNIECWNKCEGLTLDNGDTNNIQFYPWVLL